VHRLRMLATSRNRESLTKWVASGARMRILRPDLVALSEHWRSGDAPVPLPVP
jgi:hypothetical protein